MLVRVCTTLLMIAVPYGSILWSWSVGSCSTAALWMPCCIATPGSLWAIQCGSRLWLPTSPSVVLRTFFLVPNFCSQFTFPLRMLTLFHQ
ncbi:hypothetical protein HD554DRAFT_2109695 [Boletus coccyginus]|nr:hypothetical protein HD554DRAFT_2109695 [Boletus coccyginus]